MTSNIQSLDALIKSKIISKLPPKILTSRFLMKQTLFETLVNTKNQEVHEQLTNITDSRLGKTITNLIRHEKINDPNIFYYSLLNSEDLSNKILNNKYLNQMVEFDMFLSNYYKYTKNAHFTTLPIKNINNTTHKITKSEPNLNNYILALYYYQSVHKSAKNNLEVYGKGVFFMTAGLISAAGAYGLSSLLAQKLCP